MTFGEKAEELFGKDYKKKGPCEIFKVACFASNSDPGCGEWCWVGVENREFDGKLLEG